MGLKLVKNEKKYYEFIRHLRIHKENIAGFIEKVEITSKQQLIYMATHKDDYFICLDDNNMALGWIGVVENDIRLCVDNDHKNRGVGKFMINELIKLFPLAKAKVLLENKFSNILFQSCGFEIFKKDNIFNYYKIEQLKNYNLASV